MEKVFTHENRLLVFNIKNLLQAEGINCQIKNEYSSGGVGDLSPFETWPEVWVPEELGAKAREIIHQHSISEPSATKWYCSNCGEKNEGNFHVCWNCTHEK